MFVPVNGDVVNRDLLLGRVGLLLELEAFSKNVRPLHGWDFQWVYRELRDVETSLINVGISLCAYRAPGTWRPLPWTKKPPQRTWRFLP
jgi:hypothetical protein